MTYCSIFNFGCWVWLLIEYYQCLSLSRSHLYGDWVTMFVLALECSALHVQPQSLRAVDCRRFLRVINKNSDSKRMNLSAARNQLQLYQNGSCFSVSLSSLSFSLSVSRLLLTLFHTIEWIYSHCNVRNKCVTFFECWYFCRPLHLRR